MSYVAKSHTEVEQTAGKATGNERNVGVLAQ